MNDIDDHEIRDWLLHRLDAQRSAALERRLFVDADLADRIDGIECDLIDDCARGHLCAADARIVRARGAWRVRFAKALAESQRPAAEPAARPRTRVSALRCVGFGIAVAASLLLAVVGLRRPATVPAPAEQAANVALPVVTLLAGQRRGESSPIALPMHGGDVRIQAEIDDDAANPSARYVLSIANGKRALFAARGLAARTAGPYRFVEAVVPASTLGPDASRVTVALEGVQDFPVSAWDVRMPASR